MRGPNILSILILFLFPAFCFAASLSEYYAAGFDLYARKDYEKSASYMKEVLRQDPTHWKAAQVLGYDYYFSKQALPALWAFDQSLQYHPDNWEVRNLAESMRAKMVWEAERADPYPRVFRNYNIWVRLHAGVASASLGDLTQAPAGFERTYNLYNPSGSVDGFAPMVGLEVGFMFDMLNAWAMTFDAAAFNGYRGHASDTVGDYIKESYQPNMIAIQAQYYRFFKLGAFRLYANGGGGLYNTIVNLSVDDTGTLLQSGQLAGLGFGGTLGGGFEMALVDQLAVSAFVRSRYAVTDNIHGDTLQGFGAGQNMVLGFDGNGALGPYPSSVIGTNGYRSAHIDYTGFDGGLSISYHY